MESILNYPKNLNFFVLELNKFYNHTKFDKLIKDLNKNFQLIYTKEEMIKVEQSVNLFIKRIGKLCEQTISNIGYHNFFVSGFHIRMLKSVKEIELKPLIIFNELRKVKIKRNQIEEDFSDKFILNALEKFGYKTKYFTNIFFLKSEEEIKEKVLELVDRIFIKYFNFIHKISKIKLSTNVSCRESRNGLILGLTHSTKGENLKKILRMKRLIIDPPKGESCYFGVYFKFLLLNDKSLTKDKNLNVYNSNWIFDCNLVFSRALLDYCDYYCVADLISGKRTEDVFYKSKEGLPACDKLALTILKNNQVSRQEVIFTSDIPIVPFLEKIYIRDKKTFYKLKSDITIEKEFRNLMVFGERLGCQYRNKNCKEKLKRENCQDMSNVKISLNTKFSKKSKIPEYDSKSDIYKLMNFEVFFQKKKNKTKVPFLKQIKFKEY